MPDNITYTRVDAFYEDLFIKEDAHLIHALETSAAKKLPPIAVPPLHGKFLNMLVAMCGAKRVLEIGTLGGYSALCMAKALPDDGKLITLENNPVMLEVAQGNFDFAGEIGDRIELRAGEALETLAQMEEMGEAPFDFIFIDANKPRNPQYIDYAVKFARPGTVIIADNVVRGGDVVDRESSDFSVIGIQKMSDYIANHPDLEATTLQTASAKGLDGMTIVRAK